MHCLSTLFDKNSFNASSACPILPHAFILGATPKDIALESIFLKLYLEKYFNIEDDKQTWFDKMKDLAEEMGYAKEVKEYKQNPENWKGHVGDISTVLRVTLTKRQQTPDLYEIMQVLGKENIEKRINILVK